jgi:phenylacetate-CoA ligase
MRRMARITGRTDDMLIIRGVNVFPSQIEEILVAVGIFSPHYVLEVRREGRLDQLHVVVEPRDHQTSSARAEDAALALAHDIKSLIGISASVRLERPGAILRSMGKAKRVVDLRG